MEGINRFGPELALLIAAGLIVVGDVTLPMRGETRRVASVALGLAGLAVSAVCSRVLILADERGGAFEGLMVVDDFSLFFNFLFVGIAAVIILASVDLLEKSRFRAEYVALVLTSTVGMMLMASTVDLIAIFAALELQAISFYVLVAFLKDGRSSEAALKYLLLGAVSTALTLYGMAYLFGLSGSTNLNDIAAFVVGADSGTRPALVLSAVFLAAGLGFKMAVVPFQMWVPDVYQGAPRPVTAYLGSFMAIIAISNKIGAGQIADYAGVARRSPWLAAGLTACLLSLTGIPPLAGFWGKFWVFNAAVRADLVWLALIGVLNSVISAYYYVGVVLRMYTQEPASEEVFQPSPYLGRSEERRGG